MQKIIVSAKNGDFTENEDGSILVGDFRLEAGEFSIEYLATDENADIEGGYGTIIAMDTNLSDDLIAEGIARDIIRQIQDMRKEAQYQVTDRILMKISSENLDKIANFITMIETETLSTFDDTLASADAEKEIEWENFGKILITIKK